MEEERKQGRGPRGKENGVLPVQAGPAAVANQEQPPTARGVGWQGAAAAQAASALKHQGQTPAGPLRGCSLQRQSVRHHARENGGQQRAQAEQGIAGQGGGLPAAAAALGKHGLRGAGGQGGAEGT